MSNYPSVKYILIAIGVIAVLYIFAGSKPAGKGKFTEEPLSYGNVLSLISLSFIIIMISDWFTFESSIGSQWSFGWAIYIMRNVTLYCEHYEDITYAGIIASGVFWFFTGFYFYKIMSGRERFRSSQGTLTARIICAVICVPLAGFLFTLRRSDDLSMLIIFKRTLSRLGAILMTSGFHIIPVMLFMLLVSFLFVKILKLDLAGIFLMLIATLFIFIGSVREFKLVGGANFVLYPIGMLAARYDRKLTAFLKKTYLIWIIVLPVIAAGSLLVTIFRFEILRKLGYIKQGHSCFPEPGSSGITWPRWPAFTVAYFLMALAVCAMLILILMKFKNGNRVVRTISAATFELIWLSLCFIRIYFGDCEKDVSSFLCTAFLVALSVGVYLLITKITSGRSARKEPVLGEMP